MTPTAAPDGVMLTLTCLTAELSMTSTVEKYKPCFIRASVRPWETGRRGACKVTQPLLYLLYWDTEVVWDTSHFNPLWRASRTD